MTLFLILWFADLCDNVHEFTTALMILFGCLGITGVIVSIISWDEIGDMITKLVKNIKKPIVIGFLIAIVLNLILPSSKTIYIATGINAITETTKTVAESDTAKKAVELLNIKLDEYLKDAKKDK